MLIVTPRGASWASIRAWIPAKSALLSATSANKQRIIFCLYDTIFRMKIQQRASNAAITYKFSKWRMYEYKFDERYANVNDYRVVINFNVKWMYGWISCMRNAVHCFQCKISIPTIKECHIYITHQQMHIPLQFKNTIVPIPIARWHISQQHHKSTAIHHFLLWTALTHCMHAVSEC